MSVLIWSKNSRHFIEPREPHSPKILTKITERQLLTFSKESAIWSLKRLYKISFPSLLLREAQILRMILENFSFKLDKVLFILMDSLTKNLALTFYFTSLTHLLQKVTMILLWFQQSNVFHLFRSLWKICQKTAQRKCLTS